MPAKIPDGFEIYQDTSGYSRWRLHRRGRIVADGSEGYTRRADCVRAVKALRKWQRREFVLITIVNIATGRQRTYVGRDPLRRV